MKVLVGYSSAHGATAGVAAAIGRRLRRTGLKVRVRQLDEVESLATYDAVVLGSAIHDRAWLPQASAFVRRHGVDLACRPLWLFSVGSVGETSSFFAPKIAQIFRRLGSEVRQVAAFRVMLHARGHRAFAGAIARSNWGFTGDLVLRALGGHYGDSRDWEDIDSWAGQIARELQTAQLPRWTVTPPPRGERSPSGEKRESRPLESIVRVPTRIASRTPPRRATRMTPRSRGARGRMIMLA